MSKPILEMLPDVYAGYVHGLKDSGNLADIFEVVCVDELTPPRVYELGDILTTVEDVRGLPKTATCSAPNPEEPSAPFVLQVHNRTGKWTGSVNNVPIKDLLPVTVSWLPPVKQKVLAVGDVIEFRGEAVELPEHAIVLSKWSRTASALKKCNGKWFETGSFHGNALDDYLPVTILWLPPVTSQDGASR
ncbi:hypothetical protein [Arthrobacter sp. UYCo732]|uniref:hypothetical protein n=1 Tax=Arthrobacter sp. UYCo732 TaxID=3156336 RepID=UPI0033941B3A